MPQHLPATATLAALTLLITACGAKEPSTPSQGDTVPVAITIAAGNAQQAAPSASVAIPVAVKVTNAAGQPLSGVTVTFRVDSGGGSITSKSAVTSSAGTASPGIWTLGSTAGRNVLMATVGSLTPIRISATAVGGSGTVPTQAIGAGGGILEITTAGHPYQGLQLNVPAGAFSGAGSWSIGLATNAPTPVLPTGFTVAGPPLLIQTTQRRADRLMTLRIPVTRVAGTASIFVMLDPVRNRMEMVPIVASDQTSITVAAAHFNGSLIAGPPSPGSFRDAAVRPGSIQSYGFRVNVLLTALGISPANLNLAASLWPAPEGGSYAFPEGHGPAIPLMSIWGSIQNQPFGTAIKTVPMIGTLADTAALAGLMIMAKRHFTGSAASSAVLSDLAALFGALTPTNRDELSSLNLRGMMLTSRLPQLMLFPERLADVPTGRVGRAMFAALARFTPSTLWFSAPSEPMGTGQLTLGSSGFLSRTSKQTVDGPPFTAEAVLPIGGSFLFPLEQYADVPPLVMNALNASGASRQSQNNALAAQAGFPPVRLELQGTAGAGWAPDDNPIVIRDTTAKLRAVCDGCTSAIPPYAEPLQQTLATSSGPCAGGVFGFYGPACGASTMFDALGLGNATGGVLASVSVPDIVGQPMVAYRSLVPLNAPIIRRILRVLPDSQRVGIDSLVSVSAPVVNPPTQGYGMEWDWGDGSAHTLNQNVSTATHRYATSGKFTITTTLKRSNTAVLPGLSLAVAKARVEVAGESFAVWRITAVTVTPDVVPLTVGQQGTYSAIMTPFHGDSAFWGQIMRGEREGAMLFATKDVPLSIHRGLYMLPDPHTDFALIPAMPPLMISLADISSRNLLGSALLPAGAYTESGSMPDNGQITGVGRGGGGYSQVAITITPTGASGVIDKTYQVTGGMPLRVLYSWKTRITFQAVRVR